MSKSLRLVDLSANRLTGLPKAIGQLQQLRSLFLNQNRLSSEEIVMVSKRHQLK